MHDEDMGYVPITMTEIASSFVLAIILIIIINLQWPDGTMRPTLARWALILLVLGAIIMIGAVIMIIFWNYLKGRYMWDMIVLELLFFANKPTRLIGKNWISLKTGWASSLKNFIIAAVAVLVLKDATTLNKITTWLFDGAAWIKKELALVLINNTTNINTLQDNSQNLSLDSLSMVNATIYNTTIKNITAINATINPLASNVSPTNAAAGSSGSAVPALLSNMAATFGVVLNDLWQNLPAILIVWALLEVFLLALAARKRFSINDFDDDGADDKKKRGKLASRMLIMKLAELNSIYSKANETRRISSTTGIDQPIQASIKIDEIENLIKELKTTENKVPLGGGFLEISATFIASVVNTVIKGPMISGSIHEGKDDEGNNTVTLIAHVTGGKIPYRSWQVRDAGAITENIEPSLDRAINELACRIFTDLVFNSSERDLVRWKATMSFAEGLQNYRRCLRSRLDKKLMLKMAERKILETLAEDEKFNMAYYNLGVVYSELERPKAAKVAFLKSIEKSPDQWEAYYALALNLFDEVKRQGKGENSGNLIEKIDYQDVIKLCTQAITLKPESYGNEAKIYDLMGLAQRSCKPAGDVDLNNKYLSDAIRSHRKAVYLSYRALYQAEMGGRDRQCNEFSVN